MQTTNESVKLDRLEAELIENVRRVDPAYREILLAMSADYARLFPAPRSYTFLPLPTRPGKQPCVRQDGFLGLVATLPKAPK